MKDLFKSESGCFVILKVLSNSPESTKKMIYLRMVETLMEDIVKLSKATHSKIT